MVAQSSTLDQAGDWTQDLMIGDFTNFANLAGTHKVLDVVL